MNYNDLDMIHDDGESLLFFSRKSGTRIKVYYVSKQAWCITQDGYLTLTIEVELPQGEKVNDQDNRN